MTYPLVTTDSASCYRSGRLSIAETYRLAGDILAIHGLEDDRDLHLYLARQLRELPMPGGSAREIFDTAADALAFLVIFADHENSREEQLAMQVLLLIAYSKRGPGEADEWARFNIEASLWWRELIVGLHAFGAEWAAEQRDAPQ